MSSITSSLNTQHWTKQDPTEEKDDEIPPTEEPSFTYQLSWESLSDERIIAEPGENRVLWPETGRPGADIKSYIISVLSYDPATKTLSRETRTAIRHVGNYETVQECLDAVGPANQMEYSIQSRLERSRRDKDGWLATCFKEENAEALRSKQAELLTELKSQFPSVMLLDRR
ncbi:hypothetical protein B9479_002443 [Cryptococcus floricola]|uniref:Uncharacterized protein n=1 Tax=Cryptococcus floricola TaxID=2591691 RepID=A0A5D3B3W9_9TREE|nr:hypothetical protein B9479_002443 [Cryptococcus floricola]